MTTRTRAAYRCRLDGAAAPRHDAPMTHPPERAAAGAGAAPSPAAPGAAPTDRSRCSWRLPRRRGAYLTGTAGADRLVGLDAARGAALIGMMAAHVGLTTCGLTSVPGLLNQAHGRAAVLFSVIAGFSLGIMSGRTAPHTGERLVRTRLRLLVRSALLLVLGAVLSTFGTMVAIILGYYAAWLALAIPVLTWRARRLFVLAGLTAVIGPVLVQGVPWALGRAGLTISPAVPDGNDALLSFFFTGAYSGALWMAYIYLGLGLSRLDWSRSADLWRLAGAGALCAGLGCAGGWAASLAVSPQSPDSYHLISPADPAQCRLEDAVSPQGPAAPPDAASSSWTVKFGEEGGGAVADPGPPGLSQLATAAPHSETPFEALGSGGAAMTLIAVLQLVGRRARHALAPLAAMGSMSLTVYCGHIVVIWAAENPYNPTDNRFFAAMAGGFAVFAMAWLAIWARGPLEHLVHVISVRATRAPGAR